MSTNKRTKNKTRRRKKNSGVGCLLMILIVMAIIGSIIYLGISYLNDDMATNDTPREITVNIPDGSSASDIAKILADNEVIDSAMHFRVLCKLNGQGENFKSGNYTLTNHMSFTTITDYLNSGASSDGALRLTVKEGMWLSEIADEVESLGVCSKKEFMEAANSRDYDYDFVKDIPERDNLLEGYLYPNTYFLYDGMTANQIIDMLLKEFNKEIEKNNIISKAEKNNKTLDEIVIIASLIEAEVKYEPERSLVSSVIYNRLESNTKLQIDASVIYGKGERVKRVYEKDLKEENDYNTYVCDGLPKGPINSPRAASLVAACEPDDTNYLYYVVEDTTTGQHAFCTTYDEFLAAKKKYLSQVN
ncbi:MAG: endolytic transglycosylase MltG [Lachnospirales bacterium]